MKKIKSIGLSVIGILLSLIIMTGSFGITALAEGAGTFSNERTNPKMFEGSVQTSVELGGTFTVPAVETNVNVTVIAPSGEVVQFTGNTVAAEQLGIYTVKFDDAETGRTSYSYSVKCELNQDYTLEIENDAAEIPTYIRTNDTSDTGSLKAGEYFRVPYAYLTYTDEDGNRKVKDGSRQLPTFTEGGVVTFEKTENEQQVTYAYVRKPGTVFARYSLSENGKYYNQEYQIQAQKTFEDKKAPSLGVVSVPKYASVRVKTTLPVAKATDDFDERVLIKITVKFGTEDVLEVDVDDNGYAIVGTERAKVEFDNKNNMSFYPMKVGEYTVTYQAFDDSGNESAVHSYPIDVSDRQAPIISDIADYRIPSTWGLSSVVSKNNDNVDKKITFPFPAVVDNFDVQDDIIITFRITDPDSRTIINFTNITHGRTGYAGSGTTGHKAKNTNYDNNAEQTFTEEDGFPFEFSKLSTAPTGNYTVQYRLRDSKGNSYTESYTITLESQFEDRLPPVIDSIDAAKYILVGRGGDTKLNIPAVEVSDAKDTRPEVTYTFTYGSEERKLDTAVELEIKEDSETAGKYYLEGKDFERLDLSDTINLIKLSCVAKDDVGNESDELNADIAVYFIDGQNQSLTLVSSMITGSVSRVETVGGVERYKKINMGDFKITGVTDTRFAGFEVAVKDENDSYSEISLERLVIDETIYVKNFTFEPKVAGFYDIYIRVFDVSGNSFLHIYSIEVTGTIEGGIPFPSSITMPGTDADVNTRYSLKNPPKESAVYYTLLEVSGTNFSLMGDSFTAHRVGKYYFYDRYIEKSKTNDTADYKYNTDDRINYANYNLTVNDIETPVIEVLGEMPLYLAESITGELPTWKGDIDDIDALNAVVLPSVAAYTPTANAEVSIDIRETKRDSYKVEAHKVYSYYDSGVLKYTFDEDKAGAFFANKWAFAPENDDKYVITYKAVVNSGGENTQVYTLLVGDTEPPAFTVETVNFRSTRQINSVFTFDKMINIEGSTGENISAFTYAKRLLDPSGNVVSNSSLSGTDTGNTKWSVEVKGKSDIKLEKSGTYTEIYEVTDQNGNMTPYKRTFVVAPKGTGPSISMRVLSGVLIAVGVLLLVGVIFYIIRYRKVKR